MVDAFLRRLRHLVRQRQMDADIRAEIEFHRQRQHDLERGGLSFGGRRGCFAPRNGEPDEAGLAILLVAIAYMGGGDVGRGPNQGTRSKNGAGFDANTHARDGGLPGVAMSAIGIAVGMVLARAGGVLVRQMIWGIPVTDPTTFLSAAAAVLATAIVAIIIPSIRNPEAEPDHRATQFITEVL